MAFRQSAAQGERSSKRAPPTHAAQIGLSLAMEADSKGFGCGLIYKKKDRLLTLPPHQDLQSFLAICAQSVGLVWMFSCDE